jgi:hypothetical protein
VCDNIYECVHCFVAVVVLLKDSGLIFILFIFWY